VELEESRQGIIAKKFAERIVAGDFNGAHKMLAAELSQRVSPVQLQESYESMIEYGDGTPDFVGVMSILDEWPAKEPRDVGWAYVAISGERYSEGVTVVVSEEQGQYVIREIKWGQP
jgi:hypothetical protein